MGETVSVRFETEIDVTKLTIEKQLDLVSLLSESGYIVERQYRVKQKNGTVRSFVRYGRRCGDA